MRTLPILLVGALALTAQPLSAFDSGPDDPNEPAFAGAVVVTATIREEPASVLSATTRVLDRQAIDDRQATSAYELVTTLPGAQGARLGAPGQQASVFVRGAESDHVLVLWDGVPLNNPYFAGFNWAFLPTEGYDRAELVAGPYSALYGSDAVGGVVHLVTTRERPGVSFTLEAGENDHARAGLDGRIDGDRLALRGGGHWRRGDGELPNEDFDAESVFARGEWEPSPAWQVGLLVRGLDAETGIPTAAGQPTPERRIAWEEREIALPLTARGRSWELDSLASRVTYDSRFRAPGEAFSASDTESEAARLRTSLTRELDGGELGAGWLAAGAEAERLEVSDDSNFGPNLQGAEQETLSAFAQAHWQGNRWAADAGLRHDDNDVYGAATSPRAGIVLALGAHARARASYGEGFRAPSLGELFFPFFGNPDLEPEQSESWEAGLVVEGAAWSADVTLFETRFSNLVDFDENFVSVNVGRARSRGLELAGRIRGDIWEARGHLTLLEAENRITGEPLRRRAEETASLDLVLRPGAWTLDLLSRYVGARPDSDPVTFAPAENPAFQVHDLAVTWSATARLAPYARVENLLDETYSEALGFPAPGRTFVLGLRIVR
jgi:vitamin B12 transporter